MTTEESSVTSKWRNLGFWDLAPALLTFLPQTLVKITQFANKWDEVNLDKFESFL